MPNVPQRYNAAPGQHLPIVLRGPGDRQALPRFTALGIDPGLAEDAKIRYLTINALAKLLWYWRESVAGRPPRGSRSFRQCPA